ncbi:MAG: IS66 family transposase [Dehalococcoidia bacterium]|nr:IS66 family transposase [Dehalococcoidia bacterium]
METLTLLSPDVLAADLVGGATLSLAGQLVALRQQNRDLRQENETLRSSNAALEATVAQLESEVQELRVRLGQDSLNSSRPPSSDLPQAAAKRKQRKRTPSSRKRGGQPGHPGSFRGLLPLQQVDRVVVVAPEVCGPCGQPFPSTPPRRRSRAWRRQVVEFVGRLTVQVTEYQLEVRRCAECGKRTRAALPVGVPQGTCGPRLTAVVAMFTGRFRLSHREAREVLAALWEVPLSLGTVTRLQRVESAALKAPYTAMREAVQKAPVVNMDETGWRENKQRAWLWTVVTASLTVFLIDRSRSRAVVEVLLGAKFAGVVGSDRYAAYSRFAARMRALCWAHLKRDFQALSEREGAAAALGRWGLAEIARMFVLWHRFRGGEIDRGELLRLMVPVKARMGRLVRRGAASGDRKTAGFCGELTKWWEALWTFTRVEGVEPTNNVSERALRPGVLWRKGSFGSDSAAGSRFAERMMTVAATCRQQGRRLLDFLVAANEAALNGTPAPSLLPAVQGV